MAELRNFPPAKPTATVPDDVAEKRTRIKAIARLTSRFSDNEVDSVLDQVHELLNAPPAPRETPADEGHDRMETGGTTRKKATRKRKPKGKE